MDQDSLMDQADVQAQQQVLDTFQSLTHLLDGTLKLSPNPKDSKRQRKEDQSARGLVQGGRDATSEKLLAVLQLVARLALKHDQELNNLRRMDQFIIFSSREPSGALQLLLNATTTWKQNMEQSPSKHTMLPLRQHLVLELLKGLQQRVGQLLECQETDEIFVTSLKKGIILQDRSFPFLRWDMDQKQLVLDKKSPISGKKMYQHLGEMQDMCLDQTLIQRFHALKPPTNTDLMIIPWRLQLHLRSDRPYELMLQLAHNAIWMPMAAQMKPHNQAQSGLALALQKQLHPGKGKTKGTGKGKSKHPAQK